ncbi:galactose oxidase [Rhizophagus irregularis]|uniref:Galactose oxidase n=1 Tax=Rhizophagus irregularis TaxID=588596 RepID=A0A2N1MS01_9GLOM|nr:galactose oxidase [Rhizophagus irregularis]
MSKFSLIYFLLWILLQILVDVNCQSMPFKPNVIYRHTATFVDNKLYILGGKDVSNGTLVKRFFYLDVSVLYDTQRLSWQDLSNINIIPLHTDATSAKGGVNNDTLYLYRGASSDKTMALVYTFDPNRTSWNPQKITMIRKWDLTGVVDSNGKFYLWGGVNDNVAVANDMLILDTTNLNLSEGSLVNALTPRFHYGATLLPNNKIIYMGGTNDINFGKTLNLTKGALALNEVYIYDTVNDNWDTKITMGNIPSKRVGFFTILGLDGQRIIIYGGYFNNPEYSNTTLYVLDLSNYNWYVPKISGKNPSSRTFHKANVIGKYMVISFGKYNILNIVI